MTTIPIGSRIRARRRYLGITQKQLAATLGTDQPRIHEWETGFRAVKPEELPEIADALGMTVDELCGDLSTTAEER